jgi:NADPH2:quinone reductase
MRALRVVTEDGADAVELQVDLPEPDGGLVVAVRAAAVAFPDLLMTEGKYQIRQPLPFTLGWEAAGDVVSVPEGSAFAVGDRVMTMAFGAHAERLATFPEATFPLPEGFSYAEGAAFPLNYMTALAALERRGRLKAGERVLVHGAAGGVGTATIQVAKALGAEVVAAVSSDEKAEVARAAGADEVVVGDDFRGQLSAKVDVVVDSVGGTERAKDSLRSLHPEGRLVIVGFAGGEIPEIKVNRLLIGNVDVVGCSFNVLALGSGGLAEPMARLTDLAATGHLRPIIGQTYPLEQGAAALRDLADRRATGKVVLTV